MHRHCIYFRWSSVDDRCNTTIEITQTTYIQGALITFVYCYLEWLGLIYLIGYYYDTLFTHLTTKSEKTRTQNLFFSVTTATSTYGLINENIIYFIEKDEQHIFLYQLNDFSIISRIVVSWKKYEEQSRVIPRCFSQFCVYRSKINGYHGTKPR